MGEESSESKVMVSEIETSRLYLRQFSMADLNALSAIRSDPEVMRFIGAGQPHSADQVKESLEHILAGWNQHGFGRWAVVHKPDKKLMGWCGLAFLDKTEEIEIGYGISKEYWGRGFTTEAAAASIRFGFEELKLNRIVAVAMPENIASRRVMEKIGMRYEKTGHWYEAELVYYVISQDGYEPGAAVYELLRAWQIAM
jgi:ribosomal-protein-alanine N-acetyltransferase